MRDLASKIRTGDEKALEYLKNEWNQRLMTFARSYVRSRDVSEDLIQDTFIKVWETRELLERENYLVPYMFTILKNKCLDYLKHKTVELKYNNRTSEDYCYLIANLYALEDKSINIITESQIKEALFAAIKKMPQPRRDIFIMSRFKDLKNYEIAQELSISVKTVEYHISRAVSFLREELKDYFILLYFFLVR